MRGEFLATILALSVAIQQCAHLASGHSVSYSFEKNTVDNGDKVVTEIKESNFDSNSQSSPTSRRQLIVGRSLNANSHQVATNNIANGHQSSTGLLGSLTNNFSARSRPRYRGFFHRARDDDYLSTDSGRTNPNLMYEVAKLFNVKQGFYTDLYQKLDREEPKKKRLEANQISSGIY